MAATRAAAPHLWHSGPVDRSGVIDARYEIREGGSANNFVGYPAYAGAALKLDSVNASCPGEATTSFISATGADNGCRAFRAAAQLHVSYTDTRLAFATAFLKARPNTRLVTIGLGANDAFLLQDSCASAVNPPLCVELGVATLLPQISANIDTILKAIRAQFHGLLVVVNYCSLDYADAAGTGFTRLLNQAETAPAHADVLSSQMLSVRSRPLRRPPLPVATRARPGCSTPSRRTSSCAMCTPASRDRSFWHRQWSRWSKPTRRDPAGGSRGHARLVSRREARNALQERHNADPPGATLATD